MIVGMFLVASGRSGSHNFALACTSLSMFAGSLPVERSANEDKIRPAYPLSGCGS